MISSGSQENPCGPSPDTPPPLSPRRGPLLAPTFPKHPFTIGSAPALDGPGLRLFIKASGSWTTALYRLASATEADYGRGVSGRRTVPVLLDGPYGGPGNVVFEAFDKVALVVGGSGISAALGLAGSLAQARATGEARSRFLRPPPLPPACVFSRSTIGVSEADGPPPLPPPLLSIDLGSLARAARQVDVHWSVPSLAKLEAFLPYLAPLLASTTIHIYLTRSPSPAVNGGGGGGGHPISGHPKLTISFGRPDLAALVDGSIDQLVQLHNASKTPHAAAGRLPSGLALFVCGPAGMVAGLREAVGALGPGRAKSCGGCELFTESVPPSPVPSSPSPRLPALGSR